MICSFDNDPNYFGKNPMNYTNMIKDCKIE